MMRPRIIIGVSGGVVCNVWSDLPEADVQILDYDFKGDWEEYQLEAEKGIPELVEVY